jgi:LysR family hydrogen peroxide-inducible transcriptional activator
MPCRRIDGNKCVMELAQIRYFFAVCETRHFTRAARQCGISQPSLSNAIRRLEEEFGDQLFDRGPPVQLSALGEAVKPHFIAILREVDNIHRRLETPACPSEDRVAAE